MIRHPINIIPATSQILSNPDSPAPGRNRGAHCAGPRPPKKERIYGGTGSPCPTTGPAIRHATSAPADDKHGRDQVHPSRQVLNDIETEIGRFVFLIAIAQGNAAGSPAPSGGAARQLANGVDELVAGIRLPGHRLASARDDNARPGHRITRFGFDGGGQWIAKADRYDPAANTWTTLPNMPGARAEHAAFLHGGRIYLIGGRSYGFPDDCCHWKDRMKAVDVYDPATGAWSSFETPIPFEQKMRTATAGGKIHVFSLDEGRTGLYATFNPAGNSWSSVDTLPFRQRWVDGFGQRLANFEVHSLGGRILLAGGGFRKYYGIPPSERFYTDSRVEFVNTLYAFDPDTGVWSSTWSLLVGRESPAMASLGGDLYILGGHFGSGSITSMEAASSLP